MVLAMSVGAQKLLAFVLFVIGMTIWSWIVRWVVARLPESAIDFGFYVGMPVLVVATVVAGYFDRKKRIRHLNGDD